VSFIEFEMLNANTYKRFIICIMIVSTPEFSRESEGKIEDEMGFSN
jgi:hypothetical protein